MALVIRRPVTVKAIVTDGLKDELLMDLQEAMQKVELDLQQLEFEGKRLLADLEKQGSERIDVFKQQLEAERQKRLDAKKELAQKMQAVDALELGQEVVHSTVEAEWTVEVGQNWKEIYGTEIILKDDIVVEIREAGPSSSGS
ncbi:MAG: 16S rRNA processing protein RimM [Firmicutes bacterium]|mgnify:CR=1 FL=1|nr:16S rRNA processing protein RimM [Bacillota bacterium]